MVLVLVSLIFWGLLAMVIVLDIQDRASRLVTEDPSALYRLPEPGPWAILIVLAGPIFAPIYFIRSRGWAKGLLLTGVAAGLFALFLVFVRMFLGSLL